MAPLDLEFCVFKEGGEEGLVFMQDGQRLGGFLEQVFLIAGGEVGLRYVLAVTPTILDGIQLRTIGRQVFEVYWFSLTLSFEVLELVGLDGLKAVFF